MEADIDTSRAIRALVERTYQAMSTPDGDIAVFFGHDDIAVAGSGQGELFQGPDQVSKVARMIASQGLQWVPEQVKVWGRGEVAWAQILGHVEIVEDGVVQHVPYWTTGVFGWSPDGWQWLYWGGAEPQESPRV
jgi:ketosteroid isomerase-like protein